MSVPKELNDFVSKNLVDLQNKKQIFLKMLDEIDMQILEAQNLDTIVKGL